MRHLPRKKHWPYVKIGYLHHFHVFYHKFIYLHCDTRITLHGKSSPPPLFSVFPIYIFAANVLSKTGKIPSLIAFYKLFLSDIKVNILINSRHFLMVYLDVPLPPFVRFTSSVFNKWKVLRWYIYWASFIDMRSVFLQF